MAKDKITDDEDDGSSSSGGAATGGIVPSYNQLFWIDGDEKQLIGLVSDALFEQRIAVKSKGYDVTALSKSQELRNKLYDPSVSNDNDGGGSIDLDAHPELAETGGDVDPNIVVLPESEEPGMADKLQNRLKFSQKQTLDARNRQ